MREYLPSLMRGSDGVEHEVLRVYRYLQSEAGRIYTLGRMRRDADALIGDKREWDKMLRATEPLRNANSVRDPDSLAAGYRWGGNEEDYIRGNLFYQQKKAREYRKVDEDARHLEHMEAALVSASVCE
jgi:hypothetical protein